MKMRCDGRWKKYFVEMLNRLSLEIVVEVESEVEVMDEIFLGFIIKVEIRSVIVSMGVGKVFGVDGIIVELFKVDMIIIVEVLYDFFCGFVYECLS